MSAESQPSLRLEIGHVLFIDIVGYSKLLINEQSEVLQKLSEVVRATAQVRDAESAGKLIRLPSGDGMALVFRTNPEAPARCALEISQALKGHPEVRVRMGIHSGPVNEIVDVNERSNIAGGGINLAQRVMDCGDAGHILLSKRVADDLAQYREWQPQLHDLGECEVKHGGVISVFNLHTGDLGNPAVPAKLQQPHKTRAGSNPTGPPRGAERRKNTWTLIAILLASALPIIYTLYNPLKPKPPRTSPGVASPAPLPEKRIAVLPFKPLVPEDRDQILEIGMADTLIAKLSNSREIVVTSLTSVRKFGGQDQDPLAAGQALGVTSVLEGNVQRAGDHIRVTARLINVADGRSLWAGTFDEKFTDVFSVQDAISQKVADALALRLSGEEKNRLTRRYTDNLAAYQLYLTGRFHWNKLTPLDLTKSIGFFEQAIALDPTYALAYFGLAEAYRSSAPTSDLPPKQVLPQAKAAATKALELDESLAEAHASLAFSLNWFDWNWDGAEIEAKRAIALNPNSAFAHYAYAHLLSNLGRHQEATAEGARARELDPLSLILNTVDGLVLYHARRNDEAIARLQKTLELDPNFWFAHQTLGKVYLQERKHPETMAELSKAREFSGGNSEAVSLIGYVWALAGDPGKARAVLEELKSLSSQRYVPPTDVALLSYVLGEKDEAFVWLEKAYQEHDVRLCRIKVDPKWDLFRSDPRFVSILQRMGLSQ